MTLNTAIRGEQIQPATISGSHLNFSNTLGSGIQVIAYDSDEAAFKWQELPTVTINEVPSGDVDGSNTEFTLSNTPLADSERVYINGLLQEPGSGNDYTMSGNKITFSVAPESGDILLVSYLIEKSRNSAWEYGYITCDASAISTIYRLKFPFDNGPLESVGTVSVINTGAASVNSSLYLYMLGGNTNSVNISTVQRLLFPFDNGTTSIVGNIDLARDTSAQFNCSTYGYMAAGYSGGNTSNINRLQFPFNSGISNTVGYVSPISMHGPAGSNSSVYGYIMAGGDSSRRSYISRVLFPFDSGTSSLCGNTSTNKYHVSGCNSSFYGYCNGGYIPPVVSTIDRIQFPFDSGTANHVGNLTVIMRYPGSCNSSNYGFILGASIVNRIQFPFDSGIATNVSDMPLDGYACVCGDGTDFVSMFV